MRNLMLHQNQKALSDFVIAILDEPGGQLPFGLAGFVEAEPGAARAVWKFNLVPTHLPDFPAAGAKAIA